MILNIKANNVKSEGTIEQIEKEKMIVTEVKEIHRAFNIEKYINEMMEYAYYNDLLGEDSYYVPYEIVQKTGLQESLKKFYLKKAYEADLEEDIIVYFLDGYTVDEQAEKIQKDNISLMFVSDNEYNTARLYLYGTVYKDMFNYKEDISETEILKTTGLKVKKPDSEIMSRDQITMQEEFFQNKNVNSNITEKALVRRYYMDFKVNQAYNNNSKLEIKGFLFDGNFDDGYSIFETDNTEYFLKPLETPMDYEITVK